MNTLKVRLLIDHPYRGSKGTICEEPERDALAWIRNGIAEPLDAPPEPHPLQVGSGTLAVSNKRIAERKVRKTQFKGA